MATCSNSSLANPYQVRVRHLDWQIDIDFEKTVIHATATYTYDVVEKDASTLKLDTAHLEIESVTTDGKDLPYKLNPGVKCHLGTQLEVTLPENSTSGTVSIKYRTTVASSAIQWLPSGQTVGKEHPYLFTQCQAIHARSMVPCQDQPGVKMTYTATARVPEWAVCVMSAVLKEQRGTEDSQKVYVWEQNVPISSYLLAIAVGDLVKKEISGRCAIWSEPNLVNFAANEFSQTEEFLAIAEDISGMPYKWGRYDLLCLPPSFPYGGMENPCLTFVTPTLLAGDKSLAGVVAHEIAHSWTGNLVTNSSWDHFWLNEGWTVWFERKIIARFHGDDKYLDFEAIGGLKDLQDSINNEGLPKAFQSLVIKNGDGDPDDSFSSVPYERGFNLLMSLERRVGQAEFESFFQAYLQRFIETPLDSDDFKAFVLNYFKGNESIADVDWDAWYFGSGMPPQQIEFDRSLADASEKLAQSWISLDREQQDPPETDISGWTCNQTLCFLDALCQLTEKQPLKCTTLKLIDNQYEFSQTTNSEILFRFCMLSVASEDESMLMTVIYFISSQGRMKFVRPLYRSLFNSSMGKKIVLKAFKENSGFYHPICRKVIASDLLVAHDGTPLDISSTGEQAS